MIKLVLRSQKTGRNLVVLAMTSQDHATMAGGTTIGLDLGELGVQGMAKDTDLMLLYGDTSDDITRQLAAMGIEMPGFAYPSGPSVQQVKGRDRR